jgi:hypothetical protein
MVKNLKMEIPMAARMHVVVLRNVFIMVVVALISARLIIEVSRVVPVRVAIGMIAATVV